MTDLEPGDYVRVAGYRGVAFYFVGYGRTWVSFDEVTQDGEWEQDRSRARVCMVGDDRVEEVRVEEVTPLSKEAFCMDCGQIGCSHGRY